MSRRIAPKAKNARAICAANSRPISQSAATANARSPPTKTIAAAAFLPIRVVRFWRKIGMRMRAAPCRRNRSDGWALCRRSRVLFSAARFSPSCMRRRNRIAALFLSQRRRPKSARNSMRSNATPLSPVIAGCRSRKSSTSACGTTAARWECLQTTAPRAFGFRFCAKPRAASKSSIARLITIALRNNKKCAPRACPTAISMRLRRAFGRPTIFYRRRKNAQPESPKKPKPCFGAARRAARRRL